MHSRAAYTPAAATPSSQPWMSQPREAGEAAALFPRVAATPSVVERQPAAPLPQLGYGGSRAPLGGMQRLAQVSYLCWGQCDSIVSLTVCAGGLCAQTQQGVGAYIERFRQVRPDAAPEEGPQDQPLFASPPMAVPRSTPQPAGSRLDDGAHQTQGMPACLFLFMRADCAPTGFSTSAQTLALEEQRRQKARSAAEVHAGDKARQLDALILGALVDRPSRCD